MGAYRATDGTTGWVRYDLRALTRHIVVYPGLGDSVFAQPSLNAELYYHHGDTNRQIIRITERAREDGRLWLGSRGSWLLTKRFDIEWENAYSEFVQMWINGYGDKPDYFLNLTPTTNYATALAIVNKLEGLITPGDTLYLTADRSIDKTQEIVGAGAYTAWLKSYVYLASGDTAKRVEELERIIRDFGSERLFIGRAGAEASITLADPPFSSPVLDSTKTAAVLHRMIRE